MCGRYALLADDPQLVEELREIVGPVPEIVPTTYNAAPTQRLPIVRLEDGARVLRLARWGLVPAWSPEPQTKYSTINARSEEAAKKPAFRSAWKARRCVVPASGWYEWQRTDGGKTPHLIHRRDGRLLLLAGLWERWERDGQPALESYAIVTVAAHPTLAPIHDRQPALLAADQVAAWLDPATPAADLARLVTPVGDGLEAYAVSSLVNSPRNNRPECVMRAA